MSVKKSSQRSRCEWVKIKKPLYVEYHDKEWGRPIYDEQQLFEMICLEGQQAGLSWETVLNKREAYRKHFNQFDIARVARMTDNKIDKLLLKPELIRNRLKLYSIRSNAQAVITMYKSGENLRDFLWQFVEGKPIVNSYSSIKEIPVSTEISDAMSKALKKLGFKFVGTTICYAFMQAVGMVNDHTKCCYLSK